MTAEELTKERNKLATMLAQELVVESIFLEELDWNNYNAIHSQNLKHVKLLDDMNGAIRELEY